MRPLTTDPRFQPQFQPLASPSLPPADVVDFRGYFKVETFGHGAVIYRPGLPADKVYLLRLGRVRLSPGQGQEPVGPLDPQAWRPLREVLRPEGSLMEELAVSSGKCEVWSIEGRDFRALLEARPALAVDVIRALNERVRQLRQRVLGLTRKDVLPPGRDADRAGPGARRADRSWKRALPAWDHPAGPADLVGASRSFVSTLINKMKRDGLLANQGRLLVLRDEEGLNRVAAARSERGWRRWPPGRDPPLGRAGLRRRFFRRSNPPRSP